MELRPHERLLAACVGSRTDREQREVDTALAQSDMDWSAFVHGCVQHGLAPLAGWPLRAFHKDRVPPEVVAVVDRIYRANAERNAVLFRETARVVRALDAVGIRCLVLKGVSLALKVYPDPALRNFADIDLLVDRTDFEAAQQVLIACDFAPEGEPEPTTHDRAFVRFCTEDILTGTLAPEFDRTLTPELLTSCRHRVPLELHRGVFRDASGMWRDVDLAAFWEDAQQAAFPEGTLFFLPAPEAMLVHLAAHAADHGFKRLLYFQDLCEALETWRDAPSFRWERVTQLAAQFGVSRSVYRALEAVRTEFHAVVPEEALADLHCEAGGESIPPLRLPDIFAAMGAGRSETTLQRWRQSENMRERVLAARHLLAPSPASMRRMYGVRHPAALGLLYLWRPFQLAGRLFVVLWLHASRRALRRVP